MQKQVWVLTGGIASGKSTVLMYFRSYGVECFDADDAARHERVFKAKEIEQRFGTTDARTLRQIIFNDPKAKQDLEDIVLPGVMKRLNQIIEVSKFVVVEISTQTKFDHPAVTGIMTVTSDMPARIERIMKRDKIGGELACKMIVSQPSDEDRLREADIVFDNSWDETALEAQVDVFYNLRYKLLEKDS